MDRTGQDRTGQDRTGQDRTGQDRTGQDRTGQDRTGQDTDVMKNVIYMMTTKSIYEIRCKSDSRMMTLHNK